MAGTSRRRGGRAGRPSPLNKAFEPGSQDDLRPVSRTGPDSQTGPFSPPDPLITPRMWVRMMDRHHHHGEAVITHITHPIPHTPIVPSLPSPQTIRQTISSRSWSRYWSPSTAISRRRSWWLSAAPKPFRWRCRSFRTLAISDLRRVG